MKLNSIFLWLLSSLTFCCLVLTNPTRAEIIPDETLPTNSSVVTSGNQRIITGGTQVQGNLFHSFEQFSVPTGATAYFNNAINVQNIISRVTGNIPSSIDGLLQANSNANLFLLNPHGIIFGRNASLDIGGSFVVSTAKSMVFADGTLFSAKVFQTQPLLTVSVPTGLQFGKMSAEIRVKNDGHNVSVLPEKPTPLGLQLSPGNTLALVGGNIFLEGGVLTLPQGRIELGSVASESIVSLTSTNNGWILGYDSVPSFGNISLSQRAFINGTGEASNGIRNSAIHLTGKQVQFSGGSQIYAVNRATDTGGTIVINATDSLEVLGNIDSRPNTSVFATTDSMGDAGDIQINTGRLLLKNRGIVESSSRSAGGAGNITIIAKDVEVIGRHPIDKQRYSSLNTEAENTGDAGNITIKAARVQVQDGGRIVANSNVGNGGTITVDTTELIVSDDTARIEAVAIPSFGFTRGKSGNIIINAADNVILRDRFYTNPSQHPSALLVRSDGSGAAGNLQITTRKLKIEGGAVAEASTRNFGLGGTLSVTATDAVELSGRAALSQSPSSLTTGSQGTGDAGNLIIHTSKLIVRDGAEVTVSSIGSGNAGFLDITADLIRLDNHGKLTGATASGLGGDIKLEVRDLILLRHQSAIATTAQNNGSGGNVTINAPFLVAVPSENSDIAANAYAGRGGKVQINAQGIFGTQFQSRPTRKSDITASSNLGINGVVEINKPDIDPSQGLVTLPSDVVNASQKIAQGCTPGSRQRGSSFVSTGRGGIPANPIEPLIGETVITDWIVLNPETTNLPNHRHPNTAVPNPDSHKIVEAQGWVVDANGDIILVAQAFTVSHLPSQLSSTSCYTHDSNN